MFRLIMSATNTRAPAASLQLAMSRQSSPSARLAQTVRHLSGSTGQRKINNITCFGAGLMGAGIAQVAAHNGFKVTLCDVTEQAVNNGRAIIEKSISRVAKKAHPESPDSQAALVASVFNNITLSIDPVTAVKDADLVVEAIVENLKIKRELFGLLDKHASEECIFASNTSSLSIREIAESTSEARRAKFGGLHFFNPVPQMKLAEVIRTESTSSETNEALLEVCRLMKKSPVSCKDTPGFIVNRLLVPYMVEAIRMLERGDATAKDIDTAMKLGAGHPMGPIELSDFVGLDTSMHIMQGWREKVESGQETSMAPDLVKRSPLLEQKVAEGKLGRKTGEGFFKY